MPEGIDAMFVNASVFLNGTWQLTQLDVPMYTWASKSSTAPDPTAAEWRSAHPATTGVPASRPSSPAAAGASPPSTEPVGTRSGNFERSNPASPIKASSYEIAPMSRLSVTQCSVIESCDARARPVNRNPR